MNTLTITEERAQAALDLAPADLKPVFAALLGGFPEFKSYTDVKTLEDAYKLFPPTGGQQWLLAYNGTDPDVIAARSFLEITIYLRALNFLANGRKIWEPDFTNSSEWKYYAFLAYSAGSGFSRSRYVNTRTFSLVGSRLCSLNSDIAEFAATQLNKQYNRMFILNNVNIQ